MVKYDAVFWWRGGEAAGDWCESLPGADIDATVAEIRRGGRVAVKGRRSIGAPEGAPSADELRAALGVPWVEVRTETAYGSSVQIPFAVRVF